MEKPILFNTEMVRAILDGRKTQTRRLVVPHYRDGDAGYRIVTNATTGEFCYIEYYDEYENSTDRRLKPPYMPGDLLYVRETWKQATGGTAGPGLYDMFLYKADEPQDTTGLMIEGCWHPSIHMPKAAARIWLKVKAVKVQRLQEITNDDAKAEGVTCATDNSGMMHRHKFRVLWDSITDAQNRWEANPWVWVIEFERLEDKHDD